MNTTNFSRRDWLKKSTLTLGALTLIPSEIWTNNVLKAQSENSPFLYNSSNYFNEFTPPIVEENESLVILRANENPYGPPPKAAKAFQDEVFKGNRYAWKTLEDV